MKEKDREIKYIDPNGQVFIDKELYDHLETLGKAVHTPDGRELHNPIPKVAHLGLGRPLTLQEQIQRLLRVELSRQAAAQEHETFEEAQDFNVGDDFIDGDDSSPYTDLMVEEYVLDKPMPKAAASEGDKSNSPEAAAESEAGEAPA